MGTRYVGDDGKAKTETRFRGRARRVDLEEGFHNPFDKIFRNAGAVVFDRNDQRLGAFGEPHLHMRGKFGGVVAKVPAIVDDDPLRTRKPYPTR